MDRLNAYMSRDVALLLLPMFGTSSTTQTQMGAPCQVHRKSGGCLRPNIWLVNEGSYLAIARPAQRAPDLRARVLSQEQMAHRSTLTS